MAGRAFISRFSPNRTNPADLEAIFVQRHQLAEVWFDRLRGSVLTDAKHHLLAVGPRGCGKSHLVALLVGRLRADAAVRERVRIAWLPEDEITPSFWKFLLRILRALHSEYGDAFPPPPRELLVDTTDDRRAAVLTDYLLKQLDGRTLLVVVENLDDVMRGLKDEGQKRWRAFLQQHRIAATLATSQQLTEDISDRGSAFFNFFQVEHLQPLTADDALTLLRKIAEVSENTDLAGFLQTPIGRARVRAIRHLAGGSHRVFIILSEFATRENLDDLVIAFEELLDELTPYYQERLRWLPDQQREIVEFLCRQTKTVPVKEVAGELYLSEQAAAAQLKGLKDKGYVAGASVGRESRYELAEPLMRLCIEVKDPQREPIRLIVEFLQVWYDRGRVELMLDRLPVGADLERRYLVAALQAHIPGHPSPVDLAFDSDLEAARMSGNPEELVRILVERAATVSATDRCCAVAAELVGLGRGAEALAACDRAIELKPDAASAWGIRGAALATLGRHAEALEACDRSIALDNDNVVGLSLRASELVALGRHSEALEACDRVIGLIPEGAIIWVQKGATLAALGRHSEALEAYDHAIRLDANDANAWARKGVSLAYLGRLDEALESSNHSVELKPNSPFIIIVNACILLTINKANDALIISDKAINIKKNDPIAWSVRSAILAALGKPAEALMACDRAIDLNPNESSIWTRRGATLAALGRHAEALAAYDRAVGLKPDDADAWKRKGLELGYLDKNIEAVDAFDEAIKSNPCDAYAWMNRSHALNAIGRHADALASVSRAIELDPQHDYSWKNCGRALTGLARHDEAVKALRHALELKPGNALTLECLAEAFTVAGDWKQAEAELVRRFQLLRSDDNPARSWHLPDVITAIFRASSDPGVWTHRATRLAEIAAAAKGLPDLADSLVRSLTRPAYADASPDTLTAWVEVWRSVAERHPGLSLAVRLFGVGMRYLQTKDERVLLDLLQEERAILRDLFGLAESS